MFSTTDLFDYDSKIFEYDSNNNLIKISYKVNTIEKYKKVFEYDSNNNLISIKLYDANDVLIQTNN